MVCETASICALVVFLYSVFTVGATHDYLSWNRTRWKASDYLMSEACISHRYIDGGFEFNGWYGYDSKYKKSDGKSWWWVDKDDYVISFGPIIGYDEIKRYP